MRSMCSKHFAAFNLAGRVKKESEKIAAFTPEQLEVYKKKKTEESLIAPLPPSVLDKSAIECPTSP